MLIALCILLLVGILSLTFYLIFKNPFEYPYIVIDMDVSRKKLPNLENVLDEFIIENKDNFLQGIENVLLDPEEWKTQSKTCIDNSLFRRIRQKQFEQTLDDENLFNIELYKVETRYKTINYKKYPYKVNTVVQTLNCSAEYIKERYKKLKEINFECPISKYNTKDQRKLLTKELRNLIKIRDNYTCQICGKYMPDEVGLHIDHIVPISKGGKSIKSNLQVLCSKCNGSKKDKIPQQYQNNESKVDVTNILMIEKTKDATLIYLKSSSQPILKPIEEYEYWEYSFLKHHKNSLIGERVIRS